MNGGGIGVLGGVGSFQVNEIAWSTKNKGFFPSFLFTKNIKNSGFFEQSWTYFDFSN